MISRGFTPETGVGRHILHQRVECCRCEGHDRAVPPIIATHEMRLLPRRRLRLDKLSNDVINRHLQLDVVLHIRRHLHIPRGLMRWLRRFGGDHPQ